MIIELHQHVDRWKLTHLWKIYSFKCSSMQIFWCREVAGEHAAQGDRVQTSDQTGRALRAKRERNMRRGGFPQPHRDLKQGSVEPGVWRGWYRGGAGGQVVYLSLADGVTKTTWNSPRALTASSDRCYCPRQSNTTVWIRRKRTTRREYREDAQSSVQVQADTDTGESRISRGGSGRWGQDGVTEVGSLYKTLRFIINN